MSDFNQLLTEFSQRARGDLMLTGSDVQLFSTASASAPFSAVAGLPQRGLADVESRHNFYENRDLVDASLTSSLSSSSTNTSSTPDLWPRKSERHDKHTNHFQGLRDLLESQPYPYHLLPPHAFSEWSDTGDGVGTSEIGSFPAHPQAAFSRLIGDYGDTEGNALTPNKLATGTSDVEEFPAAGLIPVAVQSSAQEPSPKLPSSQASKRHRRPIQTPNTAAKRSGQSFSIMRLSATGCPPMLTSSPAPKHRRRLLQTPNASMEHSGQSFSSPVVLSPFGQAYPPQSCCHRARCPRPV